jgi:hypothetical protein
LFVGFYEKRVYDVRYSKETVAHVRNHAEIWTPEQKGGEIADGLVHSVILLDNPKRESSNSIAIICIRILYGTVIGTKKLENDLPIHNSYYDNLMTELI